MIRAEGLRKAFGAHRVLEGASFEAPRGKITLLIGPNGAGKTTTMRVAAGLARPDAGQIEIDGRSAQKDWRHYRELISFLPQSPAFHPRFTCRQILGFYAALRGVPEERIAEVIDLAGLREAEDKPSGDLSGGMRQRLGLAVLLLPEAPVLLLDEPGLSLDPEWRDRLQKILHEEAGKGRTVLVTTHLLGEWNGKADLCLLCEGGKVEEGVNPDALAFSVTPRRPRERATGPEPQHGEARPRPARAAGSPFRAVLRREVQAAMKNRYLQVFSILALAGGLFSVWMSENIEAIAHFTLQVALYSVPLFATLLGVSSARMESEEWPMLFALPVRRSLVFGAKFLAGWAVFALLLAILFAPGLFVGATVATTASLCAESVALSAVFIALGLCVGVYAADRVRALIAGMLVWIVLLFGFDLAAMALAHWPLVQKIPGFWVGLLMANPLDAFRIQALFALEQIPPETAAKAPLAQLWLDHAHAWYFFVAAAWTCALLLATARRIGRLEV